MHEEKQIVSATKSDKSHWDLSDMFFKKEYVLQAA